MGRLVSLLNENWTLLASAALGFVGVYLLLPKPRWRRPVVGAILGAAALVLTGWLVVTHVGPLPEIVLFYAFGGLAILGGGLMISQRNPVHAALSFALVILSTCGIFLLNAAPFLMAATIIIYAGAIVVTFLFVIMLAQQAGLSEADQRSREPFLASLAGFVLIGALLCVLHQSYRSRELDVAMATLRQVADARSSDDIKQLLGDPKVELGLPLVEDLRKHLPQDQRIEIDNFEGDWAKMDVPNLKDRARRLSAHRVRFGSLSTTETHLSKNSGLSPSDPDAWQTTATGTLPERLPANNVAALGKSLFSDYLVPVELAGMLLLVATIGAIAIAGRRQETLR